MPSNSLQKLRELTRLLTELEAEKQAAIENLQLERLQLRSLFDSINQPIHVSDPDTHEILYANKAAQEIHGGDIVGKKCYEVFHDLKQICPFCPNNKILGENTGKTHIWEYHSKKHNRWYRCVDRAISWPNGNGGQIVRFQLAFDITEQKKAQIALKQYSEHLEDMVEQRTRELQNAKEKIINQKKLGILGKVQNSLIHDLLVSLNIIRKTACSLNDISKEQNPEVCEMLEILEKESSKSENIIGSILDSINSFRTNLTI